MFNIFPFSLYMHCSEGRGEWVTLRPRNKAYNRLKIPLPPSAALCTPLKAFTLSDALRIRITHTQPASDSFMFMWMWATAAADDSLFPGCAPLCWGPHLCELTHRDQTGERRMGTLWVCSGFWALWKDLSSAFRPVGVSHVLQCSWVFVDGFWIISPSIFLICAHTADTHTRQTCLV